MVNVFSYHLEFLRAKHRGQQQTNVESTVYTSEPRRVRCHAIGREPRPCLTVSVDCCLTSTRARNALGQGASRRRPDLLRLPRSPLLPRLSSPCLPPSCFFGIYKARMYVGKGTVKFINLWHVAPPALVWPPNSGLHSIYPFRAASNRSGQSCVHDRECLAAAPLLQESEIKRYLAGVA